ncbi:hypothetical protein AM501_14765 [Aneurinibacillus migulanus]|jgi:hypothetical protein|uniref:Uncharacterized protein n=1 Tax=Aneurinibacillus migulanus TaxID=47500 RepID=A0A0D1YL34_ANEMI|nr:hypothetical protein TS64_01955 [Aneurinibacillus migulanus]KIV59546.1 hypothetical protein TS65_02370 [Aneurinibacillus migulanus]KON93075.1 hypothetical protein AF333_25705 [Aneurinibacillus migulanus]KPD07504.1 hypothetical protein AM501_14765 [Aneurinibacillus migulanus]GED15715.1 hypothetical protein AMI01nite_37060 [Aneurinibacillus migulanus]
MSVSTTGVRLYFYKALGIIYRGLLILYDIVAKQKGNCENKQNIFSMVNISGSEVKEQCPDIRFN